MLAGLISTRIKRGCIDTLLMMPAAQLRRAIDTLYEVYSAYLLRPRIEACPHCHSGEDIQTLSRVPLRELTVDDLENYAFCAMTTVGDVDDFRHFLPRLFELLPNGGFATCLETILGKLNYGQWQAWPLREQQVIRNYLLAAWRYSLSLPTTPSWHYSPDSESWLCAISLVESDIKPYLDAWSRDSTTEATAHLVHFVMHKYESLLTNVDPSLFWDEAQPQWRQVVHWLRSEPVRAKLEAASKDQSSPVLAIQAEEALAVVSMLKG